ncbi:hypothetical protein [endosymbiont of Acanthamoeba sp. UWC8]|uniref:hypothetical protein n=1 Tax=endosymbiont of Acanthamoeba sp. UWC8 TaxID=86106 RepID=UPI0011DDD00C|nr:hypothetical protein [endosymbiont of Acanthamoeba sp. UWC8]
MKVIGIILVVLLAIIIGTLTYAWHRLSDFNDEVYSESKFDKEIWLQVGNSYYTNDNCIRGRMYYDLKKNYLKKECP